MKKRRKVLDLRPTQFAVGMLEVDEKIKALGPLARRQRKSFIAKTPVPVIHGPDGGFYVVDHHHFLCVCYHLRIKKVRIEVVKDLSKRKMTYGEFWAWMTKNRRSYPFCQFGEGPRNELYLPKDIRGLADDPYRSLAWFVRKAGAFKNSDKNFAEFTWANFFRSEKLLDRDGIHGMEKAMLAAVALAQSPKAAHLPGYGKLNLPMRVELKTKARRKAHEIEAQAKS